jgi:hypothetical protein
MNDSACLSIWALDNFISLIEGRISVISTEIISRIETLIDSFVLFEHIYIPARYFKYEIINSLNKEEQIFKPISSDALYHSVRLSSGITVDVDLLIQNWDQINNNDFYWYRQHDPQKVTKETYDYIIANDHHNPYLYFCLWQLSLVNEISEKTSSIPIIPYSISTLKQIENSLPTNSTELILNKYTEFCNYYKSAISNILLYEEPVFNHQIIVPPFLNILTNRAKTRDDVIETLIHLRKDYKEFRNSRVKFMEQLSNNNLIKEKHKIIKDWDEAWIKLLGNEFNSPKMFNKILSLANITKYILSPVNSLKDNLTNLANSIEDRISTNKYRVFIKLKDECFQQSINNKNLATLFGIQSFID